jgi:hypothetical protein
MNTLRRSGTISSKIADNSTRIVRKMLQARGQTAPPVLWTDIVESTKNMLEERVANCIDEGLIAPHRGQRALERFSHNHDMLLMHLMPQPGRKKRAVMLIASLTRIALDIGSRDPIAFARVEKEKLAKRAEHSRAVTAAAHLRHEDVDKILLDCFDDRSLTKGATSEALKADRVFETVNKLLAEKAAELGLKPTRYKHPDSLRRRHATAKGRTPS